MNKSNLLGETIASIFPLLVIISSISCFIASIYFAFEMRTGFYILGSIIAVMLVTGVTKFIVDQIYCLIFIAIGCIPVVSMIWVVFGLLLEIAYAPFALWYVFF
ncbi:hypothetical protein ACLLKL_001932 [Escherichia coli]